MEQTMRGTSRRQAERYVWLVYGVGLIAAMYMTIGTTTLAANLFGSLAGAIVSMFTGMALLAAAAWDQATAMRGVPGRPVGTWMAFSTMGVLSAMSAFVGVAPSGAFDWLLLGMAASTYLVMALAAAVVLSTLAKIRRREAR